MTWGSTVRGVGMAAVAVAFAAACDCAGKPEVPAKERLVIVSVSPEVATDEPSPLVRIQLDKPFARAETVGLPLDAPPLRVTPEVPLEVHFADRQTLVAQFRRPLVPSTRYALRLTGELGRRTGQYEHAFVSRPLRIESVTGDDRNALPPIPALALHFNQPVRVADVLTHCAFMDAEGDGAPRVLETPGSVEPSEGTVLIQPVEALDKGHRYALACARELSGAGGPVGMAEPYSLTVATYPEAGVSHMVPAGRDVPADDVRVEVRFETPVTLDEVKEHLRIHPHVPGIRDGWLDRSRRVYTVVANLATQTDYTLLVKKGMVDAFGQKLEKSFTHEFRSGDASPQLSTETGIYALEPSTGGYPVWSRNVSTYRVACATIPKKAVVPLLTSAMAYDPWAYAATDHVDWQALSLEKHERTVRVANAKNHWHLDRLALAEMCGGRREKGLFLAEIRSDEVQRRDQDYYGAHDKRLLANVTDMGVLLKVGTASGLVWVSSLSTGDPVPGARVTLYSPAGKRVFGGRTDADGLLATPGSSKLLEQPGVDSADDFEDEYGYEDFDSYRSQRLIAVVDKADDMAVVDGTWANGIQAWNFGVPTDRSGSETRVRGFLHTDRGIYRPGETVHVRGLFREVDVGGEVRLPRARRVAVTVTDSQGASVFSREVRPTSFGSFSFDLPVTPGSALGDYHVTAEALGQTFRDRFMVEEFRKVSFEVGLTPRARHTKLGARVQMKVAADHLFGAPVVGGRVEWSVERRPHSLHFPEFAEYAFQDYTKGGDTLWFTGWEEDRGTTFISDGEGVTDKRGHYRFSLKDPARNLDGPQDYLIRAQVRDDTDQTVTKRISVTAHETPFYLGLHAQEYVQAVNMPFAVNVVAVDPDGRRVGKRAKLTLTREMRRCEWAGEYRAYATCETHRKKVMERDIVVPEVGAATERIVAKDPGTYAVRVVAEDGSGKRVTAATHVFLLGKGEAFWSGDESARMTLVASKPEYVPGDTARLVPQASMTRPTALVTLERDGIVEAHVVRMESPGEGLEVSITDALAPNVFASVALVQGRTGEGDRHRPRFKMGMVDLKVRSDRKRLEVRVETNESSYEPGEMVRGKVRVLAEGKPVKAEVALSAADEGVLQLIAFKTPDPMKKFYASWELGVDSATNWNRIARLHDPSEVDLEEGGDSGASMNGEFRSRFVSSAFWEPALVTDASGEVPFAFPAPDNLTAFRLMAVVADAGSRFGSGEHRIAVRKPLLVKPVVPRFLSEKDRVRIGAVVHNFTGKAGIAEVTARAEGAYVAGGGKSVEVPAGESVRVFFTARAKARKEARFDFSARMGDQRDAVRVTVPVRRPLAFEHRALAEGTLGPSAPSTVTAVAWPEGVDRRASVLRVSVDRTGLAELEPSLRYLIEYPYGCLEQTLSRFIPLAKVDDLADSLGLDELKGPKLRAFLRAGAAKVARHQRADGHFALWPSGPGNPSLTVYALYGLSEARRAGVRVSDRAMAEGLAAMRRWALGGDRVLTGGEGATVAMAAFLMAELGTPDAGLNARLYEARAGLPRYGQAFVLRALHRERGPDEAVRVLAADLSDAATSVGGRMLVPETSAAGLDLYMSSDVRTTAIVLSALLEADPKNPRIDPLVRGLKESRRAGGFWMNTQENLYALVALADVARREATGTSTVTVKVPGRRAKKKRLVGHGSLVMELPLGRIEPGDIEIQSEGKVRYAVRMTLAREDRAAQPLDHGIAVYREYYDAKTGALLTDFKQNQLVKVRLSLVTPEARSFVAVVDPLPAGLEAVNERFETEGAGDGSGAGSDRYDPWARFDRAYGFRYRELRDDRYQAFADQLTGGAHHLEYLARATTAGDFRAPPAHAEAMYEPEVSGRSGAREVKVTR